MMSFNPNFKRAIRVSFLMIGTIGFLPAPVSAQTVTPVNAVVTPKPALARIKDIASIEGIRENQLVGYGIVVGLQGTGDSQQTGFPVQTLAATLLRMGVSVPATAIRVQNLAAVFISATLPEMVRKESRSRIDKPQPELARRETTATGG